MRVCRRIDFPVPANEGGVIESVTRNEKEWRTCWACEKKTLSFMYGGVEDAKLFWVHQSGIVICG